MSPEQHQKHHTSRKMSTWNSDTQTVYQLDREPRQQRDKRSSIDSIDAQLDSQQLDPQGRERRISHGFMSPSHRSMLSPSSTSSHHSHYDSSLSSSFISDQYSQSSYSYSSKECCEPARSRAEGASMAWSASPEERRLSMPLHGEASHSTSSSRRSGIPHGFEHLLHPPEQTRRSVESGHPDPASTIASQASSRLRLHIRQEPIATRACSAGEKDRRTIDPPPILQLLLVDFNPNSETDLATLQNSRYAVACLLYSVERPGPDGKERLVHSSRVVESARRRHHDSGRASGRSGSDATATSPNFNEQSSQRSVQILSGGTYVSPFHAPYDPDPDNAPLYPSSRHSHSHGQGDYHRSRQRTSITDISQSPATFFVFTDLSVRTAGTYRLRFRLMDWGATMETGKAQPILADVYSEPFRVYSSKDFPGMRASSALTWNLRRMGMMDLKPREGKGKGVGKKAKQRTEQSSK